MRGSFLAIALLFLSSYRLFSVNYYFSSSTGSDNYSATQARNPATPWKSIEKLNASMSLINPGDSILFKRGDTFRGQIVLTRSGTAAAKIVFSAYGGGKAPILSGNIPITGWSRYNGDIWVANCLELDSVVTNFLLNGVSQQLGRYPNANSTNGGYLKIDTHIGKTQISSASLTNSLNWTNGEAVIRTRHWILDRSYILSNNTNTLLFREPTTYDILNNYGFFLQNHLNTLDQNGEWFYNASSKMLYVYYNGDLNNAKTEATAFFSIFETKNRQNFVIEGLTFIGSLYNAISIKYSTDFEIINNVLIESGNNAISITYSKNIKCNNNKLSNINNNAIDIRKSYNLEINSNSLRNIALRPGMGSGREGNYMGFFLSGTNIDCENNIMDSLGYCGIWFNGDSIKVKNNYITNFCITKDDGGAIYTWTELNQKNYLRLIENNITTNGIGAGIGTNDEKYAHTEGIYLDNRAHNVVIKGNTVANCNGSGIYIHNAYDFSILNNTLFNNCNQLNFLHDNSGIDYPITGIQVQDNLLFSYSDKQLIGNYRSIENNIKEFGVFNQNSYCRPVNENQIIKVTYGSTSGTVNKSMDLSSWKQTYNYDLNSFSSFYQLPLYSIKELLGSNKILNGSFNQNITAWNSWSLRGNDIMMWDNNNKLDNGSLGLSFSNPSLSENGQMLVYCYLGEISANKTYILRFSMMSSLPDNKIKVALKSSQSSRYLIAKEIFFDVTTERHEYELLFIADSSESNGRLEFTIVENGSSYWMDNIEFYEATIEVIASQESITLFTNPSTAIKTINDNNYYIDVKGNVYHNFTIQPYHSLILLKVTKEYLNIVNDSIKVTSITVSSANGLNMITSPNGTMQLSAKILPDDATDKSVTWSITNGTDKVRINSSGLVTALADGIVTIKATANDGSGIYNTKEITISNQVTSVTNITVTSLNGANTISSDKGTLQLIANVSPADASNKTITWSVEAVTGQAEINPSGLLSAISNGIVIVKAISNGGSGVSGTLEITIINQGLTAPDNNIKKKKTRYIDPANIHDIAQDGSIEHPYDSWKKIAWSDGDSILQKKGTVAKEESILLGASNVFLGSYGTGDLPVIESNTNDYVIRAFEKYNVQIRDLHIKADQALSSIYMIGENSKSIQIMNCRFESAENGIRIMGGDELIVSRNIFTGCSHAIYHYAKKSLIYYNVFKDNDIGVSSLANSASSYFYNNVFYNNSIGISNTYSELTLFNNIFYMNDINDIAIDHKVSKLLSDHNIFYPERYGFIKNAETVYSTLAELQQFANLDRHSLTSDPRFMNVADDDFSVEPGSPAIDAGEVVGLLEDFFGNAVPQGGIPDIGLLEAGISNHTTSQDDYEDTQEKLIKVYPNPSNGRFNLQLKHTGTLDAAVSVKDLSGKTVYNRKYSSELNLETEIDLTNLPNGIYVVVVETENKTFKEPVVISH